MLSCYTLKLLLVEGSTTQYQLASNTVINFDELFQSLRSFKRRLRETSDDLKKIVDHMHKFHKWVNYLIVTVGGWQIVTHLLLGIVLVFGLFLICLFKELNWIDFVDYTLEEGAYLLVVP
jgi:hypothetical protein